ncbi:uncharacterized protein MELLADRAFT_110003 [Melampsora larici-populina 98AG31]|uniref:Uncharacterized protein n=1 Tax=Melampsora larici-populina (strain 98AG31 / pathotype 3-4-7) TaxID=747676 RepID=F4RYB6_MELLP|nr:uncharacterized protein MELLADRAFT_110003 [Melampsora larici-populina 98AG31]EGG02649.1 hypothetical protein MELLADRAFT_110003 [Melampsora larici-populina 98AG31]
MGITNNRYSLPSNLGLDEADQPLWLEEAEKAKTLIREGQANTAAKRLRLEAETGLPLNNKRAPTISTPLASLQDRLTANTRRTLDPFLSSFSSRSIATSRLRSWLGSSHIVVRPTLSKSSSSSILKAPTPQKPKLEQK